MTTTCTHVSSAVARVAAVAVVAAALSTMLIAPVAAKTDKAKTKARSAEETATVQDVSGLSVTRTWKIDKRDPNTLVTTITVKNANTAPITTSIVEPIPTTSLKRITFKPLKMHTSSIPGLGRYDITVPSGGDLTFGYKARLVPDRKANAQDRLATVKGEMEATLPAAQATDADRAVAATKDRYIGIIRVTEEIPEGVDLERSRVGETNTIVVRITTAPYCRVVGRGCGFPAQDNYALEPRLATLDPAGLSLVSTGSADLAQSGMTCAGTDEPGVMVKHWTFEPSGWKLTWSGWEVTQGQYTIVEDLSSPANGRCGSASIHTVLAGLMTG